MLYVGIQLIHENTFFSILSFKLHELKCQLWATLFPQIMYLISLAMYKFIMFYFKPIHMIRYTLEKSDR